MAIIMIRGADSGYYFSLMEFRRYKFLQKYLVKRKAKKKHPA